MTALADKLAALGITPVDGDAFQPFSPAQIAGLETAIGGQLPEDYRQFLTTFGRSTFSSFINCTPHAKPLYFGWFLGFDELLQAIDALEDTLPETIIAIADDSGGNTFCLGVRDADAGKVYFHHHSIGWHADAERYVQRGEPVPAGIRYQTVHQIASSFSEFVNAMEPEE